MVSLSFYKNSKREFNLRFEAETEDVLHDIRARMTRYELALVQARAYLMLAEKISDADFQDYLKNTELMERYPGIQGLGFIKKLSSYEINAHVAERKKTWPDYQIWPDQKGDVTSVMYLAPMNWRNRRAIGFNMMTEPVRRTAMEKARDTGRAALSGILTLMQENSVDPQPGLILFMPYFGKAVPESESERRIKLQGYLSAPIRFHDFVKSIFVHSKINDFDFEIYETQTSGKENLIFDHDKSWNSNSGLVKALRIGEFTYPVKFSYKRNFEPRPDILSSVFIFAFGLFVTFLVFWNFQIMNSQVLLKERSLIAKDEFMSVASHELKTPITSVQMQLQLLQRSFKSSNPPSQEKIERAIANSIQQVGKMNRLIEELLETSRLERGRLNYHFELTNLTRLVSETFENHPEMLGVLKDKIEFHLSDEVSAVCDRFRLEQVLTNLLANAVKYGDGSLITVKVWKDHRNAYISVKDRGPGISVSLQTKIFERFERGMNNKSIGGLGLGLYISRQIILAHQGTIRVESSEGKGSEFIVEIPLSRSV